MAETEVCLLQLNVEGLTQSKRDLIQHIANQHQANILLLQETHCVTEEKLLINGFDLISFIGHNKHGIACYTKQGINARALQQSPANSAIEWCTKEALGTTFCNIYKPPPAELEISFLPTIPVNSFVCGDFNCRNIKWGYSNTDRNGSVASDWAESNNLHLLFDNKDPRTFYSGRHGTWTCPDLSFVSNNISRRCNRMVLPKFPRSGHSPIIISSDIKLAISSLNRRRWNFRKANWQRFSELTRKLTPSLPDPSSNVNGAYNAFCILLNKAAKLSIPRGRRDPHVPCWDKDCEKLFADYLTATDTNQRSIFGDQLLDLLGQKRRGRWEEEVNNINFTHSSRKAWNTINRLTGRSCPAKPCPVTANAIASVLADNGRWKDRSSEAKAFTREVVPDIKKLTRTVPQSSPLSQPISSEEISAALKSLKENKAPGNDNIHTEFLKNMSHESLTWVQHFLSNCLDRTLSAYDWSVCL